MWAGRDPACLTSESLHRAQAGPGTPCPGLKQLASPRATRTHSGQPPPPSAPLRSPLNELLEHIPSEVLTDLLDVRLREEGRGWRGAREGADRLPGLAGREAWARSPTWKRSGGTCLFARWPWTCSVALLEKGWEDRGGVNSPGRRVRPPAPGALRPRAGSAGTHVRAGQQLLHDVGVEDLPAAGQPLLLRLQLLVFPDLEDKIPGDLRPRQPGGTGHL